MNRREVISGVLRKVRLREGLGEEGVARQLRERGFDRMSARRVKGFENGGRMPPLEILVELLRVYGLSLAQLETLMAGKKADAEGPVLPADGAERIGPALGVVRERAGWTRSDLVARLQKEGRRMSVEKLERWESGLLMPTILGVLWAMSAMERSLEELDREIQLSGRLGL